ncbi:MAG TPA: sulfotransferase [Rhizomicrobium sp.]|jgi:Flp pilus assembly protein TadD|nr:sulfotransferase [Rhizomicrobium sp.]
MTDRKKPTPQRQERFSFLASEVGEAIKAGDALRAAKCSRIALQEGFTHPTFLNLAAYNEMSEGRPRDALTFLSRAKVLAPKDMNILNAIGTCHAALGDFSAALATYDAAIAGAPDLAPAYYNRGLAHNALGDFARARSNFERAVALRPAYPEALAQLAYSDAVRGAHDRARDYARRALEHDARQVTAVMAFALADIAEGKFEQAEQSLVARLHDPSLAGDNRAILLNLIGDARDGTGNTNGAFSAYAEANALQYTIYREVVAPTAFESPFSQLERLIGHFTSAPRVALEESNLPPGSRKAPIFLIGFPRSGTTLLEQALAGHPAITTSEEREFLVDAITDFIVPSNGLAKLATLSSVQVAHYRDAYWRRAAGVALPEGQFLDKLPLNTTFLPVIAKIFPDAKILFARRDPRDVVFSCFRRRFAMTPQMYELLTLDGAARYYDRVMRLAELYRSKLGISWKEVIYENVVADFEGEVRGVCAFLGLPWHSAIGDFAHRLSARSVDTPSSYQLTKGLNREGIGSWRRYRQHMEPVLGLLAPWVSRFGYSET